MAGLKKGEQTGKYAGIHTSTGLTRRGEVEVQKAMRELVANGYLVGKATDGLASLRKLNPYEFNQLKKAYQEHRLPTDNRVKRAIEKGHRTPENIKGGKVVALRAVVYKGRGERNQDWQDIIDSGRQYDVEDYEEFFSPNEKEKRER